MKVLYERKRRDLGLDLLLDLGPLRGRSYWDMLRALRGGSGNNTASQYGAETRSSVARGTHHEFLGFRPLIRIRGLG